MPDLTALVIEMTTEILESEGRSADGIGPDTALFGEDGILDSMGIVSLIVAVEQEVEDRHGVPVSLADERALSQTEGPYRSIGSLAIYAAEVMEAAS